MDLQEKLPFFLAVTDNALHSYLDENDRQGAIFDAMRYSVFSEGKRIRPFLCLEFCEMFGGELDAALPFACALEMIHTYSLIHDDLPSMDNDDMRRGKPASHKVYGESGAIVAGDALQSEAFAIAASNELVSAECIKRAIFTLATCAGPDGMAGGQMNDLTFDGKGNLLQELIELDIKKTAALFRAGCVLGVLAAGGSEDKIEMAENFADAFGLAFQITDDILDADKNEKTSILRALSRNEAVKFAEMLIGRAKQALDGYKKTDQLIELCDMVLSRTR